MSVNNCSFLTVARQGRSSWKLYLAGLLLIFAIIIGISLLVILPLGIADATRAGVPFDQDSLDQTFSGNPQRYLLTSTIAFGSILIGLGVAMSRIHRRAFLTLISADTSIRWRRIAHSFVGWFGLWAINIIILAIIYPQRYIWTFDWAEWWPIAPWSVTLYIIRATFNILFYSYTLQAVSSFIHKPILVSVVWSVSGGLFYLGSAEPSGLGLVVSIVHYWLIAWLILKDDRLELAIGIMLANAATAWLVATPPGSLIQLPGVFTLANPTYDIVGLLNVLIRSALFLYPICFGWASHPFSLTADR